MTLEYITTRELGNSSGKITGKIKILKLKEESEADIGLTCPECNNSEKRNEAWTDPFVTGTGANKKFSLQCGKCGFNIKVMKLKKEAKKKK